MQGKVLLLTGVPAVGKTTLAKYLQGLIRPLHVIMFGEVLLEVKRVVSLNATYEGLRINPTKEASIELIDKATSVLLERINQLRGTTNIIIDSHAVAKYEGGFRISPDSHCILQKMRLDAVLVLHAKPDIIISRISERAEGRRQVTSDEVAVHQALQDAVSIAYAVTTGCPVFIINVDGTLADIGEKALNVFDSIGMSYSHGSSHHD
jgi:adenylate kinase